MVFGSRFKNAVIGYFAREPHRGAAHGGQTGQDWPPCAATYVGLKRYDDAIRDATDALEIDSRNIMAAANRAQAYWCQGRNDEAIKDAAAVLKIQPDNFYALKVLQGATAEKQSPWRRLLLDAVRKFQQ